MDHSNVPQAFYHFSSGMCRKEASLYEQGKSPACFMHVHCFYAHWLRQRANQLDLLALIGAEHPFHETSGE